MNNEQIKKQLEEHSTQLTRLDERIAILKDTDEKVTRLNGYFQICGVFLLILGIGSGYLTSRFFAAQREIDGLTAKLKNSEQELTALLDAAKKQFDSHVNANPVVATLQMKVNQVESALTPPDPASNGGPLSRSRTGSPDNDSVTVICPPGTYMYGITFTKNKGSDHGIVNNVVPLYRPFLQAADKAQP